MANSNHYLYSATTFGENVTVFCAPGFSPQDGIILTCDENGNWIEVNETCQKVDCGDPPTIDGAVAYFNSTSLNATVKLKL